MDKHSPSLAKRQTTSNILNKFCTLNYIPFKLCYSSLVKYDYLLRNNQKLGKKLSLELILYLFSRVALLELTSLLNQGYINCHTNTMKDVLYFDI